MDEFKERITKTARELLEAGKGIVEISKELGVPRNTLKGWLEQLGWYRSKYK